MISIDKIDGNSKLGNAVFSAGGRKSNYQYACFQQSFEEKQARLDRAKVLSEQQETFNEYRKYMQNVQGEKKNIKGKLLNIEEDQRRASAKYQPSPEKQEVKTSFEKKKNRFSLPPKPSALEKSRSSASVNGTSGFKAISRVQYYKVHTDPNRSKIAAPGHYRPRHEVIHKRALSAKIRPAATETSEPMAKAQAIKEYNFDASHVCARLLRSHDISRLNANQKAYYEEYSKSRENMKLEREGGPINPLSLTNEQSSSALLQPEKSEENKNLMSEYQEVKDQREKSVEKTQTSQDQSRSQEIKPVMPSSTKSQHIAGGPNHHVFSVQNQKSQKFKMRFSGRNSVSNLKIQQRECEKRPGLTQSSSHQNTGIKRIESAKSQATLGQRLFSNDCLSLKVSTDHTLIRNFPNQEVILHDRDHLLHQQHKKIGADVFEPSRSCKLLDFTGHLARRDRPINLAEPCAAAGGPGREFINVDELIQAQIQEGIHGIDAFTSPFTNTPNNLGGPKFFSYNSSQNLPFKNQNYQISTRNSHYKLATQPSGIDISSPSASTQMTFMHGNKTVVKKGRIKSAAAQRQGIQVGLSKHMTNTQSNLLGTQTATNDLRTKNSQVMDVSFALQPGPSQIEFIPDIETSEFQIKVGNLDSPQDPNQEVDRAKDHLASQVVPLKDTTSKRTVQFTEFVDTDDVNQNSETKEQYEIRQKSAFGRLIINEASEEDLQNVQEVSESPHLITGSYREIMPPQMEDFAMSQRMEFHKQTRLHTLVKKVPGDVNFDIQQGRIDQFPQIKMLDPAEISAAFQNGRPNHARVAGRNLPVFAPFNYPVDFTPHPLLEDPSKQKKLIAFDKQVTRNVCHTKNNQLEPNLNQMNNLGRNFIQSQEIRGMDVMQKNFEKLGHVKTTKGTNFSKKAKTGRDRLYKNQDTNEKSTKGSHTGPDIIRKTERYQNILRDNAQVDYLEQFHYPDKKKTQTKRKVKR